MYHDLLLDKPRSIIGLHPEDLEGVFVFGILLEVGLGEATGYLFLVGWVNESDDSSLEAGAGEATTIDALHRADDVVDGDELRGAALVVVDGALAGVEAELPEELQVACLPGGHSLTDPAVFAVEVFGPAGKTGGHHVTRLIEHGLGDVPKVGLVEGLEGLLLVGQHAPGCGLAFIDAQVVVAVDEAAGEAGEEDAYLEQILHPFLPGEADACAEGDVTVLVAVTIEEEQLLLTPKGYTGLVQEAVVEPDVLALCLGGYLSHFEGLQSDAVGLGEGHDVGDEDGGRGAESAYGQGTSYDALDAVGEVEPFLQGVLGATGVVTPVLVPDLGGFLDVELHLALEGLGVEPHGGVTAHIEPEVNAFVDGKARDQSMLVIDVSTQGADPVG